MGWLDDAVSQVQGIVNPAGGQGAGGDLWNSLTGQKSADKAAQAQIDAANMANRTQLEIFNRQQANAQPWLDAGKGALSDIQQQMPDMTRQFTMQDFHQDPGYQFQLDQGLQAMQRSAAAKGMLSSVGTQQNLNNYAQGTADQQYQNAYSRFTDNQKQRYNMLSGLAGTGQVASGQMGAAGQNYANQFGNNMSGIGNAQSAAAMQGYKGMSGMLQNGATLAMLA